MAGKESGLPSFKKESRGVFFGLVLLLGLVCSLHPLPVISKCSFDSLSLEECFEEFLVGVSGLTAQLLLSLPPQSLQESPSRKQGEMKRLSGNRTPVRNAFTHTVTYKGLLLQQRCVPIKHKDRPDAEEKQLADAVEESEQVGVLDAVAVPVPHSFHRLVQPYTDV